MLREILWRNRMQPLSNAMDALTNRHRSIASNIANIDSEGHKRTEVVFEEHMKRALGENGPRLTGTDKKHMPQKQDIADVRHTFRNVDEGKHPYLASGVNTVDVDVEMARLATNRIHYDAIAKIAQKRFHGMTGIIKGYST